MCAYKRCSSLSSVGSWHVHGLPLGRTDRKIKHAVGIRERMGVSWVGERISGGVLINMQGRSCPTKVSPEGQGKFFGSICLRKLHIGEMERPQIKWPVTAQQLSLNIWMLTIKETKSVEKSGSDKIILVEQIVCIYQIPLYLHLLL